MIDLHAHSNHSDGSLSPAGLVDFAAAQGLRALALTDHDCISGIEEAGKRALNLGLRFIPGVELEIETTDGEFHLLGLNLCGDLRPFEDKLAWLRDHRARRNERILRKMNDDGRKVTEADIAALSGGEVISRLHFAAYLVKTGAVASISEAFERYLDKGRPYYDAKQALRFDEAIPLIHAAGGKAIMAHPLSLGLEWEKLMPYLLDRRGSGLDGLEAYHSDFPRADCRRLEEFARAAGFIVTAGSDFHGESWPSRRLGHTSGGEPIGDEFLSWLPGPA